MSARKELIESIESALNFNKDGAEKFFDKVVSAIKEELTPKDQTYQEFFGLDEKPELIQGYTAEQWQEIIDGGYLCEGASCGDDWEYMLLDCIPQDQGAPYYRPAQLKGVMRPIFVEPVDKDTMCACFHQEDKHVYSGKWSEMENVRSASTKYIEL